MIDLPIDSLGEKLKLAGESRMRWIFIFVYFLRRNSDRESANRTKKEFCQLSAIESTYPVRGNETCALAGLLFGLAVGEVHLVPSVTWRTSAATVRLFYYSPFSPVFYDSFVLCSAIRSDRSTKKRNSCVNDQFGEDSGKRKQF